MNPEERIRDLARRHSIAPSGVTIASDKTMVIGQVLMVGGFRFAVAEELTRDEFDRRVEANRIRRIEQERARGLPPGEISSQAGFHAAVEASKVVAGTDEFIDGPTPDMQHYYAMRRI